MKITSTADLGKVIRSKRKNWVIHRRSYLSIRGSVPVLSQILKMEKKQQSLEKHCFWLQLLGLDLMINDRGEMCEKITGLY